MAEVIDELLKYEKGWTDNMGDYWRERMERLRTIDTGALYASIKGHLEQGTVTTIEHTFLQYGIYVAAGVGPAHVWKKWTEAQEIIAFVDLQQGNAIIAIYLLRIISVPDILSGNY